MIINSCFYEVIENQLDLKNEKNIDKIKKNRKQYINRINEHREEKKSFLDMREWKMANQEW